MLDTTTKMRNNPLTVGGGSLWSERSVSSLTPWKTKKKEENFKATIRNIFSSLWSLFQTSEWAWEGKQIFTSCWITFLSPQKSVPFECIWKWAPKHGWTMTGHWIIFRPETQKLLMRLFFFFLQATWLLEQILSKCKYKYLIIPWFKCLCQ